MLQIWCYLAAEDYDIGCHGWGGNTLPRRPNPAIVPPVLFKMLRNQVEWLEQL